MTRRNAILAASVFILALAVRLWSIGSRSLYLDETATTAAALAPDWGEFWQRVSGPEVGKGPLYYLFLRAWCSVAGTSELALRVPSAVFGALAAAAVSLWAAWMCRASHRPEGRAEDSSRGEMLAGLVAGGIVTFHPVLIALSREARSYSVSHAFAFAAAAGCLPAYLAGGGFSARAQSLWRILVPVLAAVGVSSHLFTGFFVVGLLFAVGWVLHSEQKSLRPLALGAGCFFALLLLQVPLTLRQVGAHYGGGGQDPVLGLRDWGAYCRDLLGGPPLAYLLLPASLFAVLRRRSLPMLRLPLGALLVSGVLVVGIHCLVKPILLSGPRYMAWEAAPLALVVASLVEGGPWVRRVLFAALLVGLPLGLLHQRRFESKYWEDWRTVGAILEREAKGSDAIACMAGHVSRPLLHYFRSAAPVVPLQGREWKGDLARLRGSLSAGGRVWLVWSHAGELTWTDLRDLEGILGPAREMHTQFAIRVLRFGP